MSADNEEAARPLSVDQGGSVTSAHAMGVRRLRSELKKARGTMSQKAAAKAWDVPLATLTAIEQGVVRNYQPHTLARFDHVLGRSAWELYDAADEPGVDVPAASAAELAQLRDRLDAVEAALAAAVARRSLTVLETLVDQLDNGERAEVVQFIHFVLGRRRPLADGA